MRIKISYLLSLLVCLFFLPATAAKGPTYAIVNCRIVSPPLPVIEKGVIIIRDGLIEAVGIQGKIDIPEDAQIIEAEGMTAYPGLINAHTNLFLEEAQEPAQRAPGATRPQAPAERTPTRPDLHVLTQPKPRKSDIDNFHRIGVTTVLVAPQRGIFWSNVAHPEFYDYGRRPRLANGPYFDHRGSWIHWLTFGRRAARAGALGVRY